MLPTHAELRAKEMAAVPQLGMGFLAMEKSRVRCGSGYIAGFSNSGGDYEFFGECGRFAVYRRCDPDW
jgi:hypothetical protein